MKPRKMKPIKLVEMQKEWWAMYEVGPNGFYATDYESNPVINAWHSYSFWGARLFGLIHNGEVVSFCAAKFYKTKPEVHIYLNYVPKPHRGKGYGKEMKRQLFELVMKEGFSRITVDCQTPEGERLYADGAVMGTNKYESIQKRYELDDGGSCEGNLPTGITSFDGRQPGASHPTDCKCPHCHIRRKDKNGSATVLQR